MIPLPFMLNKQEQRTLWGWLELRSSGLKLQGLAEKYFYLFPPQNPVI